MTDKEKKDLPLWATEGGDAKPQRQAESKSLYPTEIAEQIEIFRWASEAAKEYPDLKWLHAIPNGGLRSPVESARLKASGVRKGVSDMCLPVKSHLGFSGLYIELKRYKVGVGPSPEQKEFISFVQTQGFQGVVCYGAKEAIRVIRAYLNIPDSV